MMMMHAPSTPLHHPQPTNQPPTPPAPGCNEESEAEQLLAKAQRVFSRFDPSEGGFIQAADLRAVLIDLDLLAVALDERAHERIKARLEMPGAGGLILWQDFWQVGGWVGGWEKNLFDGSLATIHSLPPFGGG